MDTDTRLYAEAKALSADEIQALLQYERTEFSQNWEKLKLREPISAHMFSLLALFRLKQSQCNEIRRAIDSGILERSYEGEAFRLWRDCKVLLEMLPRDIAVEICSQVGEPLPERFRITPEGQIYVIALTLLSNPASSQTQEEEFAEEPYIPYFQ